MLADFVVCVLNVFILLIMNDLIINAYNLGISSFTVKTEHGFIRVNLAYYENKEK